MNRDRNPTLLIPAGLTVLLTLALAARAGLAVAAPAPPGTPAVGLVVALAAFLAALWTLYLAKGMVPARREDARAEETRSEAVPAPAVQPAPPPRPAPAQSSGEEPGAEALMLLSLLQEKGRLVDFVMEDIAGFSNEQVGAAARVVHQGCRAVLVEAFSPLPVAPAENARITLEPGYDAEEFRLVGAAAGRPPFTVKVTHKGWRARHVKLPRRMRQGTAAGGPGAGSAGTPVIVPAEVTA